MLRFLLCIGYIFLCQPCFAQNSEADSLQAEKIKAAIAQSRILYKTNLDSALFVLDAIRDDLIQLNDPKLTAVAAINMANVLLHKQEYARVREELTPMLKYKNRIDSSKLGLIYRGIGNSYRMEWVSDSAVANFIRALKLYRPGRDDRLLSALYLDLGMVYDKLNNTELSEGFFEKSMQYSSNSKIMERHKSYITDKAERPVSRKTILELSLDIMRLAEDQNDDRLLTVAYSDVKKNYFGLQNYDKALEYAEKELALVGKTKFDAHLPNNLYLIGTIHAIQNKPQQAITSFTKALPTASDSLKLSIYMRLKENYTRTGNSQMAIEVMEKYISLKDSITSKNIEASFAEIAAQYQTELQKEQIKTLEVENDLGEATIKQQQVTLFGTIGLAVLILILGWLGINNYKARQELSRTQLNFKLLQTQMNPHFMFNALNEINSSLGSNDAEKSSKYLTAYSKLMRSILESSSHEFVSVAADISLISNYLELQQLVHNHNFTFDVAVSEELNTHYLQIPPMLTQPYVENAILHGVNGVSEGHIQVNYELKNDAVLIEIVDNGKGVLIKENHSGNELHTSMGTHIITQRVQTYGELHKFDIVINTQAGKTNGTIVRLKFPTKTLAKK